MTSPFEKKRIWTLTLFFGETSINPPSDWPFAEEYRGTYVVTHLVNQEFFDESPVVETATLFLKAIQITNFGHRWSPFCTSQVEQLQVIFIEGCWKILSRIQPFMRINHVKPLAGRFWVAWYCLVVLSCRKMVGSNGKGVLFGTVGELQDHHCISLHYTFQSFGRY